MTFSIPQPISILIADDHKLYVDSLVIALQQQTEPVLKVVATAWNGEELLTHLATKKPDILLLDLNMPVMNGLDALPILRSDYPLLKTIIVTKYNDPKFVRECLQIHDVAGYILKTSPLKELLDGILSVFKGQSYISRDLQLYPKDLAEEDDVPVFEESFLARYNLTRRELEILSLIAQAKSNAEIADYLFIRPQTVGAHRKNLIRKLTMSSTAGLVRFAIENQLG